MIRKTIMLCTLALLLPLAAHATNGVLAVNAADEYEVADYADLKVVGIGNYAPSATYRLTADIDASPSVTENNDSGFVPIGKTAEFTGKFHGSGYVISGLTTNYPALNNLGLFGTIGSGAVVDSLGLEGGSIAGGNPCVYAGNLAGINKGTIASSHATGSVECMSSDYNVTGGLVGYNVGSIVGSYATGLVVGTSAGPTAGWAAGGLAGYNAGSIVGSYATGFVVGMGQGAGGAAGGLVGINLHAGASYGNITNSYATGSITVAREAADAGGLVGLNEVGCTISGSFATSHIGDLSALVLVGGLAGENNGFITKSYWNSSQVGQFTSACGVNSTAACNTHNGLTTSQMMQSTNLDSLDFTNTWYQYNGHTYPLLRSFMTPLTVTAKDTTKTYDGAVLTGGNGVAFSLSSVQSNLILGAPSYGGSSQGAIDTGNYTIKVDSLWSTQQGYLITYVDGTLRINPKPLIIAGLSAKRKIYDGNVSTTLAGTASLTGVVHSEAVTVIGTANARFADKNVGTGKPVTVTGLSLDGSAKGNYSLSSSFLLSADITPYPITVTADAKSMTVGGTEPALTYTADALLGTDTWSGALSREKGKTVGSYDILIGTLDAGDNYEISFNSAIFSIAKATAIEPAHLASRSRSLSLLQNSGAEMRFAYTIPNSGNVTIELVSLLGQKLFVAECGTQNAGVYTVTVESENLSTGKYTAVLRVNGNVIANTIVTRLK